MNPIRQAIEILGGYSATARACRVTYAAVRRWHKNGRLPRTELTGETQYAKAMAKALTQLRAHKISRTTLLDQTRKSFAKR
jgi:hypothetical protein